ncbi:hypothetical protein WUBG_13589, partial [Wuchereria bancrofti]
MKVFAGWLQLTNLIGKYSRYNLNRTQHLSIRRPNLEDFDNDTPITQIGEFIAQIVAQEIAENHQIGSIYSSPAL